MRIMNKILKSDQICQDIENLVSNKDFGYIEAIVYYAESKGLEVTDIPKFLNEKIKSDIEMEAENLNYLKKKSRL